jgi:Ras GTPase-activating-like protein IQGAP2/3
MLQNLANKPSYAKEAYMMTLNPFVENNKARINQFLNSLCEVGDFYDTLEVCPLLSLFWTRVTIKFRWINTWRFPKKTS